MSLASSVLITGGTGSLGRALTRCLLASSVRRLCILSRDEVKQVAMAEQFAEDAERLRFFLGDVRDGRRLLDAFHGVETVVHAAALKRVDKITYDPSEALQTNVMGTLNVVRASMDTGVKRVLLVSSDKAVEPTTFYGASKMMAECIAVSMNATSWPRGTAVSVLRYGNVLASRGSVVEVWRRQHAAREPLTLTDPRMTRFVLTRRQAAGFVERAVELMHGGEVFVPVLPACTVRDLLEAATGVALRPLGGSWVVSPEQHNEGARICVIGRRPGGEKLHEVLLNRDEVQRTVALGPDMWCVVPAVHPWRADEPQQGELLPAEARYDSQACGWRLGVESLQKLLEEEKD